MNNYYEENANKYIEDTLSCNMKEQYDFFLKYMKKQGKILDIGFGSGRDIIYFSSLGYNLTGIDITGAFIYNMKSAGYDVHYKNVEDLDYDNKFDGIWACASLLHVEKNNLKETLIKCINALKSDGVMYCSFKYGDYDGIVNGRYFNYLNEEKFEKMIENTPIDLVDLHISNDVRSSRKDEKWLNLILRRKK